MPTKTLSFVEAIKACFAKYATFSGRARRSEFWWFYLLNAIPTMIISYMGKWKMGLIDKAQNEISAYMSEHLFDEGFDINAYQAEIEAQYASYDTIFYVVVGICAIISLALLIPMLAAWVRRLHDVGKSGHMLWLFLLCGIGGLIPLVMAIPDGKPEPNQYGPSPKYAAPEPPVAPAV